MPQKSIPGRLKSISTSIDEKKYADAFAGRIESQGCRNRSLRLGEPGSLDFDDLGSE